FSFSDGFDGGCGGVAVVFSGGCGVSAPDVVVVRCCFGACSCRLVFSTVLTMVVVETQWFFRRVWCVGA
ncbi:hypothetical protein A2U01_0089648, partial [Trifolium medium]|nr:hypothetical protein [Trifolium medium]